MPLLRQDSAYLSRRLHIHPVDAVTALQGWHRDLPLVRVAPQYRRLADGLWLSTDPEPIIFDAQLLHAIRGVIWMCGRPIRVLLEITRWSSSECEAAIRPMSLAWPVCSDRYDRRVTALLDDIVGTLAFPGVPASFETREPTPLRPLRGRVPTVV